MNSGPGTDPENPEFRNILMSKTPAILWFRNDLRIEDNPALFAARESGHPVIPVFILDENVEHAPGGASRWWLHHSLASLASDLEKAGVKLILRRGDTEKILLELVDETQASHVFWNRRYHNSQIEIDKALKSELTSKGVSVETFNGNLLREPWEVKTGSGGPYRVYTPFWKSLRTMGPARNEPLPRIRKINGPDAFPKSDALTSWRLMPRNPDWASEFATEWTPGEHGARDRLNDFLNEPVAHYADGRNRPDCDYTSKLSPHLAFGEISPIKIWHVTQDRIASGDVTQTSAEKFLSEIAWREFSCNLLFYNHQMPTTPLRSEFANYPWRNDEQALVAWQRGQTGYPIVDAGMRQLWRTGWMHNRVRMIVASFLIKDLLIDWRDGAEWFWDTLVDADLANNSASWQWVAGCGADAAPYFRIFNPITQGEKFDPNGDYVRKYVPELAKMPAKYIHAPWKAPQEILEKADVSLGKNYQKPFLDHSQARQRALDGYAEIRQN